MLRKVFAKHLPSILEELGVRKIVLSEDLKNSARNLVKLIKQNE